LFALDQPAVEHEAAIGLPFPLAEQVRGDEDGSAARGFAVKMRLQPPPPVGIQAQPGFVEHQQKAVRLDAAGDMDGFFATAVDGRCEPVLFRIGWHGISCVEPERAFGQLGQSLSGRIARAWHR